MSTYLYLVCLDHTPPLRAASESGQHLYDLPQSAISLVLDEINRRTGCPNEFNEVFR